MMTDAQRRLTNAIVVLSSRKAAIEEEIADVNRQKSAPISVLKKRAADLEKQIADRKTKLEKPPKSPPA